MGCHVQWGEFMYCDDRVLEKKSSWITRSLLASSFIFLTSLQPHTVWAQAASEVPHQHLVATCVHVPPGEKRPDFGCFILASAKELKFERKSIYWHLRTFPDRNAAEAAKSPAGLVMEEDGQVWLSEFGDKEMKIKGGTPVAVVGPLELAPARSYDAEIAVGIMRPGDRSRVHTHAGPEAWYVFAGEQCLETTAGTTRAHVGETMSVVPNIPMELKITGKGVRRAFALVIHDSAKDWGATSEWKPTGACGE